MAGSLAWHLAAWWANLTAVCSAFRSAGLMDELRAASLESDSVERTACHWAAHLDDLRAAQKDGLKAESTDFQKADRWERPKVAWSDFLTADWKAGKTADSRVSRLAGSTDMHWAETRVHYLAALTGHPTAATRVHQKADWTEQQMAGPKDSWKELRWVDLRAENSAAWWANLTAACSAFRSAGLMDELRVESLGTHLVGQMVCHWAGNLGDLRAALRDGLKAESTAKHWVVHSALSMAVH